MIWQRVPRDSTVYVDRCSHCGAFKRFLYKHWFFSGLYCISCIQDVLYDNCRNLKEVNKNA